MEFLTGPNCFVSILQFGDSIWHWVGK